MIPSSLFSYEEISVVSRTPSDGSLEAGPLALMKTAGRVSQRTHILQQSGHRI